MISVHQYFAVLSKSSNSCSLTHECRAAARHSWMCSGCTSVKPSTTSVDVWLQEKSPANKPFNFVFVGGGIRLVHSDLLLQFGEENIARDLYIGRVYGGAGNELTDWSTVRGRKRVLLRGSSDVKHRICPDCGQLLYSALGPSYLYPEPPEDAAIFESNLCGFVVRKEVAERIAAIKSRRMSIEPLPILDPPPDGLGILPLQASD